MADELKYTVLDVPDTNPFNIQGTKKFVFNQTGNILVSTTVEKDGEIPKEARDLFAEVSVFFAGMTKSISQTLNPETKQYYSLYDYNAIEAIVDGSGYFIHISEQDIYSKSNSIGVNFSQELIAGVLGLAVGGAVLPFANAMVNSMVKATRVDINRNVSAAGNKIANIMFVCEYIMGMPLITAIVLSIDKSQVEKAYNIGPCFSSTSVETKLNIHKDSYMFLTPTFIKEYAHELNSEMYNTDYIQFISHLKSLVRREPSFVKIVDEAGNEVLGKDLSENHNYLIIGEYLGTDVNLTSDSDMVEIISGQSGGGNMVGFSFKIKDTSQDRLFFSITIKGTSPYTKEKYTLYTYNLNWLCCTNI